MKEFSSTILKGRALQRIIMTSATSAKKSINQISNHLKQIAERNGVVSLSANQLANQKSIFVMLQKHLIKNNKFFNYKHKSTSYCSFINPKILDYSVDEVLVWEQCPSYPNVKFLIKRSTHIIAEYEKSFRDKAPLPEQWKGFQAILFQHECTHLSCINLFDIAQEIELIENLQNPQLQKKRIKLKEQFQKFKTIRDSSGITNNLSNGIESKQQNKYQYKDCVELRNFVEYEILNPL